jgi:hypothetical protein
MTDRVYTIVNSEVQIKLFDELKSKNSEIGIDFISKMKLLNDYDGVGKMYFDTKVPIDIAIMLGGKGKPADGYRLVTWKEFVDNIPEPKEE